MKTEDKIKRAFDCRGCADYDFETGKCNSQTVIVASYEVDSFGKPICYAHRNRKSGKLTGGFSYVEPKPVKRRKKVWFTSDLHANHLRCLIFKPDRAKAFSVDTKEPEAIRKHDEYLIKMWNDQVAKEDDVYILGDVCMGNREETMHFVEKLHGHKFLIRGNHDKGCNGNERFFEWVGDIKEAKFSNNQFPFIDPNETFCVEMCHYPMLTWNRRTHGTCMVHGHCHGSIDDLNEKSMELRVDVGIDSRLAGFNLVDLETLYKYFTDIRDKSGCKTFQEYVEWLMSNQGFRM